MLKLIPDWAHHDEEFWQTIRRRNLWFIKLRYGAVVMLVSIILASELLLGFDLSIVQITALTIITTSIFLYNGIFHFIRKFIQHDANKFNPLHLSVFQMISDLIALLLLVHFTGGIESPMYIFFVFHLIVGSLILPGVFIYSFAAAIIISFVGISIGEFYGLLNHHHINGFLTFHFYNNSSYLISTLFVFSFVIVMIVVLANYIANQLYKREQQLLESIDKINAAEKEKQKYIMGVVHEIKTPLNAVHAYIELILQKFLGPLDEVVEEKLKRAKRRSDEAVELINDVLKVSQMKLTDDIIFDSVNFSEVFAAVIKRFKPAAAAKSINFKLKDERKHKGKINGDAFLLQIAFSNIIGNALKYTANEGTVEVVVTDNLTNVTIEVCDNGPGIPEKEKEKIFRDFYRATNIKKEFSEGSGLGLSIVKQIIERHKGSISVESPSRLQQPDKPGSVFVISLPYQQS